MNLQKSSELMKISKVIKRPLTLVSDFLNNPSPDKKRKAIEINDGISVAIDDDVSDISSNRATLTEVSNN